MYKTVGLIALVAAFGIVFANTSNQINQQGKSINPVLITVGNQTISKLDFETLFYQWLKKINSDRDTGQTDIETFLAGLVKYKFLTLEARQLLENQNPDLEFKKSLQQKINTAEFYQQVQQAMLHEAFIRSHYIVDAEHILLAFDQDNNQLLKSEIYDLALDLKRKLNDSNKDFTQYASNYSDDEYSKANGGQLGLFTVFEQIYPVETAAYNTAVGSVSDPIESRFGYHLVKTNKKIKINGLKSVSHILVKSNAENTTAKQKIFEIYSKLNTENFAELARQYSEDSKSAVKGGKLGTDRLINELELKKYELKPGEISQPFHSESGWHIMRVDKLLEFESYWQQHPKLKEMIKLDSRTERAIESISANRLNDSLRKLVQSHQDFFIIMNFLKQSTITVNPAVSSELELIDRIINSKLDFDFSELKDKYSVEINKQELATVFN